MKRREPRTASTNSIRQMSKATRRLVLHIGVEKTGTTSLQMVLSESEDTLAKLDIYYPRSPQEKSDRSHKLLAGAFIPHRRRSFLAPRNRDIDRTELLDRLSAELDQTAASTVVISSEHLHSRYHSDTECAELVQALSSIGFEDITVVAYLRRQDHLVQAAYREAVRFGSCERPEVVAANIGKRQGMFWFGNYEQLLNRWALTVGRENVVPRIYDRALLVGGSIETDFLAWLRSDAEVSGLHRADANRSWPAEVTQYIARVNAGWRDKPAPLAALMRNKLAHDLLRLDAVGGKHIFTPDERRTIRDAFEKSNANVAATFFPDADGGLFGATAPDTGEPAHRVDDARFEEITAALRAG